MAQTAVTYEAEVIHMPINLPIAYDAASSLSHKMLHDMVLKQVPKRS